MPRLRHPPLEDLGDLIHHVLILIMSATSYDFGLGMRLQGGEKAVAFWKSLILSLKLLV